MLDVAVIISGSGSNLQALIDACACDDFPARIVKVISNNTDAYGLERAKKAGIETSVINHKDYETRTEFEDALDDCLKKSGAKIICLAGFMRVLKGDFVNRWKNRILNIHPSILPAFRGLHTQERALEAGVRFTGCTVHFVSAELDGGPIILQAITSIEQDDTSDTLNAKVLKLEHQIYPEALLLVAKGRVRVAENRVNIENTIFPDSSIICPSISE
jgi:phosphoribosylglycinamide formyltransferase-1